MKFSKGVKTIRMKLFLVFFLSIVSLIAVGVIMNVFFLESYYVYKNEGFFEDMKNRVTTEFTQNNKGIEAYLEDIGKRQEMNLEIVDKKGKVEFSSIAKGQRGEDLPKEVFEAFEKHQSSLGSGHVYTVVTNDKNETDKKKLLYLYQLTKDQYLILSKPVSWITESVEITNQFSALTGLIIIVVGGFMTYIISSRATRPILEMNQVAKQISELRFDTQIKIKTSDEIGDLGKSINTISEKLSESIDILKSDIERRKQLVRDISHELKTPIGVIKGYSEGIQYGVADTPEMTEKYLQTIVDECNRMDKMVKELIELSRYEYVEQEAVIEAIEVESIFSTLKERFDPIFNENDLDVEWIGNGKETVRADYHLITRALSNFITNAIKYVDRNKLIRIEVSNQEKETVFSVFNSGEAIPESECTKIWDVFYKIDETRAKHSKSGSGLGLSIVKQIAALHAGSVEIVNHGNGVSFKLKIPRKTY